MDRLLSPSGGALLRSATCEAVFIHAVNVLLDFWPKVLTQRLSAWRRGGTKIVPHLGACGLATPSRVVYGALAARCVAVDDRDDEVTLEVLRRTTNIHSARATEEDRLNKTHSATRPSCSFAAHDKLVNGRNKNKKSQGTHAICWHMMISEWADVWG